MNEELTFIADKFESLFIPVKIDKEILNIGTIYRTPSGKIPTFVTEFESKILGQIPNSNTLIAGDFNLDLLKEPNQSTTQFITNMSDKNLMNVINKVTREAESASGHKSATIIDHIWSSLEISKSFTLEYPLSDHFLTGCNISIDTRSPLKTTYFYRKFSEKRMNTFKKHFNEYNRTIDFHAISDPNAQISELIGKLKDLINLHFPLTRKTCACKSICSPWVDRDLKRLIHKKHVIYKLYKCGRATYNCFKIYRNLLNKTLTVAKKQYYANRLKNVKGNPKKTWNIINKLAKPNKKPKKLKLKIDNEITESPEVICEALKKFYSSINGNTSQKPSPSKVNPLVYIDQHIPLNQHSFFFTPITPFEIFQSIKYLKENNFNTAELPTKVLKQINEPLSIVLSILFNKCVETNSFPNCLKIAKIIPIPKKANSLTVEEFRPISIINPLTKIFEN